MKKIGIVLLMVVMLVAMTAVTFAEPLVFGDQKIDLYQLSKEELTKLKTEIEEEIERNYEITSEEKDAVYEVTKEAVEAIFKQKGIEIKWPWFDYEYTKERESFTITTRADHDDTSDKVYAQVERADGKYTVKFLMIGDTVALDPVTTTVVMPEAAATTETTQEETTAETETPAAPTATTTEEAPAETTEEKEAPKGQYAKSLVSKVNVRVSPDRNAKSLGQLNKNDTVYVFDFGEGDKDTAWAHISSKVGEGYVLAKYLEVTDQVDEKLSTTSTKEAAAQETEEKEKTPAEIEKEYKDKCKKLDYNRVKRDPDKYDGQFIRVIGRVIKIEEGWFDSVTCQIMENGNVWVVGYTYKEGEKKIAEKDTVTFYGTCAGVVEDTNARGNEVTMPKVEAEYMTIR